MTEHGTRDAAVRATHGQDVSALPELLNYVLPPHLIAQEPAVQRDQSRLLVADRSTGHLSHHVFADLSELLASGDLLVLNDTRVLPARLFGRRTRTGGKWEGLFLCQPAEGAWELLCQTRGRLEAGEVIAVDPGSLELRLLRKTPEGHWIVRPSEAGPAADVLARYGQTPLPPYIRKGRAEPDDLERYQTVYARSAGAVAAPTAGLHFTPQVFERLQACGIEWTFLTLHVGLGTFQPLQTEDFRKHPMHREWGELSEATATAIRNCRSRGGRIVAVGTTSVRVLETAAASGIIAPWQGDTNLYIYPGYTFRVVDALVTNFHLPQTTLLLLVGAFAGISLTQRAYQTAIEREYRFYSYGDAMLVR
jgi:S-adenosylmethionine:tRNA ribosyltransferase-isomerase